MPWQTRARLLLLATAVLAVGFLATRHEEGDVGVVSLGDIDVIPHAPLPPVAPADGWISVDVGETGEQVVLESTPYSVSAVVDHRRLYESFDGTNWDLRTAPTSIALKWSGRSADGLVVVGEDGSAAIDRGDGDWHECSLGDERNPAVWDGVVTAESIVLAGDTADGPWIWSSTDGCVWTGAALPTDSAALPTDTVVGEMAMLGDELTVLGADRSVEPSRPVYWTLDIDTGEWRYVTGRHPLRAAVVSPWSDERTLLRPTDSGVEQLTLPRLDPELVTKAATAIQTGDAIIVVGSQYDNQGSFEGRDSAIMWQETRDGFVPSMIATVPGSYGLDMGAAVTFNGSIIVAGSYVKTVGPPFEERTPVVLVSLDPHPL